MAWNPLTAPALAVCLLQPGLRAQDTPGSVPVPAETAPPAPVRPAPATGAAPAPRPETRPAPLLDDGLLDPAWFGPGITFTKGDDLDYAWVKPGLDLTGRTVRMAPWEEPQFRGKGRSRKDHAKGTELTDSFPGILRGAVAEALQGRARVSRDEGDLVLTGRLVDAKAGSKGAKWLIGLGAGNESATWDLKLTDVRTGEVLLAVHHRVYSLTQMTNVQDKLVKWADKLASFLADRALAKELARN